MKRPADFVQSRRQIVFNFLVFQSDKADSKRFNQFLAKLVGFLLVFMDGPIKFND